ncbi:fluoride efflux transporter FluC [Microbacterium telephonicum]|uniref:Fluoride-specific ion channel FluC n=1 Tax=Microbacterium telephonicum TaxID=1714841 RepID=A0A498C9B9_9MICO|nr:CrcB family protein [Microbacterium telephonicum]RLK52332.1 camphor resistance protein CrcB [Microbacterium telephonicum]
MVRAGWFSPGALLLVMLGGAVGVAARAVVTVPLGVLPHPLVVPAATLAINLAGSLLLGVVVGAFDDQRPRLRAFLGTGVLGGFTTYSAFAVQSVTVGAAAPLVGLALMAVSLLGGVLCAGVGLHLGRRLAGRSVDAAEPVEAAE